MNSARWSQIKSVLSNALEHDDDTSRAEFLKQACAHDTALRREVESLLSQSSDRLDRCAEELQATHTFSSNSIVGERIGAYAIVRELGRGGMGAVYLAARADQQFEKQVAIKLLKRGTDTDEVLRRFRAEREILARLDHPNIGRLFDGGTTQAGLPYFVMEYIEGVPVTDFCKVHRLSVENRLRLFLKICSAVRFAHQNLVIHRDLKPANILITPEGEPKLLDFGIAKLVEIGEGAIALTLHDHQRLTPAYASPEQVRGEPATTVSDVYSLGTLLYEILTGKNAHRFSTSRPAPTELLRVVGEEIPLRPSAVVDDGIMSRRLRGDLDNIVLKALSKEPNRRYGGVGDLAGDIRRHLEDLPVQARPATLRYNTVKFVRRNKTGVIAACLVIIALVGGIVATTLAARAAQVQRRRAERRFSEMRKIANSLMFEFHNSIKDLPGALPARQLVIRRALEYLDSLAQEAGNDLSLKSELATAYEKIGLITFDVNQAIDSHRKAVALKEALVRAAPEKMSYRKQLSESYGDLSDVFKIAGRSSESILYAGKALTVMQALAGNVADKETQQALANCYLSVGIALMNAGDTKGALKTDLMAMETEQRVASRHPQDKETLHVLAGIYAQISDAYEEEADQNSALAHTSKQMDIARDLLKSDPANARYRRDLWAACFRSGRQLARTGDSAQALKEYDEAKTLIEGLSSADPGDKGHRRWLAKTYFALGELLTRVNRPNDALEYYQKAILISEQLLGADAGRVETRYDLAEMYEVKGLFLAENRQLTRALEDLLRSQSLAQESAAQDPENVRVLARLARVYEDLATFYLRAAQQPKSYGAGRRENIQKAQNVYQRSLDIWQDLKNRDKLAAIDAANPDRVARELAGCDAALD